MFVMAAQINFRFSFFISFGDFFILFVNLLQSIFSVKSKHFAAVKKMSKEELDDNAAKFKKFMENAYNYQVGAFLCNGVNSS